jgi:GxxExxY protein
MIESKITGAVIGAAIEVHKSLGPGLLESAYEVALKKELELRGFRVRQQVGLPVVYKDEKTDLGYRIDLLVEDKVVVEVKSVEALHDVHLAQILTYLRLSHRRLGLLINFNVKMLKDGIRRVIQGY